MELHAGAKGNGRVLGTTSDKPAHRDLSAHHTPQWRKMTEQIDWQAKQPSQVACFFENPTCWGAWDTTCEYKAKDITLSITWRRESWKEGALDDLPWKDERGPSSITRILEPFQRQSREIWQTEWSAYGLFRAYRYYPELNWTELSAQWFPSLLCGVFAGTYSPYILNMFRIYLPLAFSHIFTLYSWRVQSLRTSRFQPDGSAHLDKRRRQTRLFQLTHASISTDQRRLIIVSKPAQTRALLTLQRYSAMSVFVRMRWIAKAYLWASRFKGSTMDYLPLEYEY